MKKFIIVLFAVLFAFTACNINQLVDDMNDVADSAEGEDVFALEVISCKQVDSYIGNGLFGETELTPSEGDMFVEVEAKVTNKTGKYQSFGSGPLDAVFFHTEEGGTSYEAEEYYGMYHSGNFFSLEPYKDETFTWHFSVPEDSVFHNSYVSLVGLDIKTVKAYCTFYSTQAE